jgi:hypothetical protein
VNNGKKVSFWLDPWLDGKPLCSTYPILYGLCVNRDYSVHEVSECRWVIPFKIILPPLIRDMWYELARRLNRVVLTMDEDKPVWKWTADKKFSVKFVYLELTKNEGGPNFRFIWKNKLPEKIKKCMWLIAQDAILTKDNMIRRQWQGDPGCYFYGVPEDRDHLFFKCPVSKVVWGVLALCSHQATRPSSYGQYWAWVRSAIPGGQEVYVLGLAAICWATWKARNRTCFDKKPIKSPMDVCSYNIGQICMLKGRGR